MKRPNAGKSGGASIAGNQRGFTLLETVIALSIIAVVVGILLGAMRLGISSWEKGEHYVEVTGAKMSLSGILAADVSSMYPYEVENVMTGEKFNVFVGRADSILFVTSARSGSLTGLPWGGLRLVQYVVDERGLVIKEKTVPSAALFDEAAGEVYELEPGARSVGFEYYNGYSWEGSWRMSDEQKLPSAVRARIFFRDDRRPLIMTMPVSLMQPTYNGGQERSM